MARLFILCFLPMLLLQGCDSELKTGSSKVQGGPYADQSPAPKAENTSVPPSPSQEKQDSGFQVLSGPSKVSLVELISEAIPSWRPYRSRHPALILFSGDPFLLPIPDDMKASVAKLVIEGTGSEIREHGADRADTILPTEQTLSAVLESGLFSQVLWVIPLETTEEAVASDKLRDHLLATGSISTQEAKSIVPTPDGFSARFRNIPFRVTQFPSFQNLTELDSPVILHFDMTYFRSLYINEVKTPLFDLLHRNLIALRQTGLQTLNVSISMANLNDAVSLDARFLGPTLAEIFREPSLLDGEIPKNWALRRDALYLDNFFQPGKITKLYKDMQETAPSDGSIYYGLYKTYSQSKSQDAAFRSLNEAVRLDNTYALEYLHLAEEYAARKEYKSALGYLEKASICFPENPFIKISMARNALLSGTLEGARPLIAELKAMPWSEVYHQTVPAYLEELEHAASKMPVGH